MMRASYFRPFPLLFLAAILVALAVLFIHDTPPAQAQAVTPGSLDATFGTAGTVTTDIGSGATRAKAVALQSDGKIVAAGWAIGSGADFALARYNADGTLDDTFGEVVSGSTRSGKAITSFSSGNDQAYAVAVQSDGKIVVAGYATISATGQDFALARYNANGTLDTSFSGDGKVTTAIASGSGSDEASAVAVQSDGKIVAAGRSGADFALARYNADGTLDDTFGTVVSGSTRSGKQTTDFASGLDVAYAVAVQSDGKIVAAGKSAALFGLARYNANGVLDTSFSSDGKVTTDIASGGTDIAYAMEVQSNGKLVLAGQGGGDFGLARYNADGTLDDTFGEVVSANTRSGKVTTDFASGTDQAYAVTVQSNGKIVAAGYGGLTATSRDFALARYNANGTLDTGFGTGGKVTTAIASGAVIDEARGVAVQSDGKIVLAGHSDNDFALARYQNTLLGPTDLFALAAESSTDGNTFSALTLSPAFDAATTGYRATVGNDVTHVRLTPTVADSGASVTVNGNAVTTGTASERTALAVGDNAITVRVTASDSTTQDYTVTVWRASANTLVSNLGQNVSSNLGTNGRSVAQGFTTGSTAGGYTLTSIDLVIESNPTETQRDTIRAELWSNATGGGPDSKLANGDLTVPAHPITAGTVTFTAPANTTLDASTTYWVVAYTTGAFDLKIDLTTSSNEDSGSAAGWSIGDSTYFVSSNQPSGAWTENLSSNLLRIRVNGPESTLSSDTDLSNLAASSSADGNTFTTLTLTPSTFNPATTGYTATVANNITHVKLTPTLSDTANASVTVNGSPVTTGTASQSIAVSVGANAITVRVTAQDTTTKDYTVTITRQGVAQSSDATLSGLTGTPCTSSTSCSGALTLSPAFNAATTGYTAMVANTITHVKLTPTVNHSAATVTVGGSPVTTGTASRAISVNVGANAITVRVTAEDSTTKAYTVTITRLAIQVEGWSPTLKVRNVGGASLGCRNNVSGAACSDPSVLTSDEFDYTRYIYGQESTVTFSVQELYHTTSSRPAVPGDDHKLVLVTNARLPRGFVLSVVNPHSLDATPRRFLLAHATIEGHGNVARWSYNSSPRVDGPMKWLAGTSVQLGMERPRATLDTIEVYYDGITSDDPDGVDGFMNWAVATPATYGYRVNIPGEFPSIDPDKGVVQVTHARLKVHAEHPGSTTWIREVTYDSQGNNPTRGNWVFVTAGDLTSAIELNTNSPNTHVDVGVSDGDIFKTYLLNIDPPPRTYSVSPRAHVVEGQDALLTLTLSQPAPAGGVEFTVTAGHGTAGADDLGAITSPVTVPESSSSLAMAVPTVDDDLDEGEEIFTVTVAPAGFGWGVASLGTNTATVTIVDNDDAPPEQGDQSPQAKYADLIARVKEWRNDPCCVNNQDHTDRWDRVLLAFGETVADTTLEPMTAAEAQTYANNGWTRWIEVTKALRELENRAPTVASAIADAVIINEGGTRQVSLSGVFSDADNDPLTITAVSSNQAVATALAAPDGSTLTVNAYARGQAEITVTAEDAYGLTVEDTFTVTVKAAPVVSTALADISGLAVDATQEVSLSGVFSDADGDTLIITAVSSDNAKATVTVAADRSKLTVAGVAEGTATITVTARDSDDNRVSDAFDVSVTAPPPQETPNRAPTVSSAIADATIVKESGTEQVSLSGVFSDADNDSLTVTATSSNPAVATVSVASGYASLTVTARARGMATITITAADGNGGTVSDTFTVTVKAAPVVASAISDISGLEAGSKREVSLAGVFSDADGDSLTITAGSSDETKATVTVASDGSSLTLTGVAAGTTTITVTAQDSDSNQVSDTFDVSVVEAETEAEGDGPTPVLNLSCIAETDRVAFLWDAPEWSGGDLYAYDYQLTLPGGRNEGGRYTGTVLYRPGSYQLGADTSVSVTAVYETADGQEVSSAEATLTCTVQ